MAKYIGKRTCPECNTPIKQSDSTGRDRVYCSNACKMKAYRHKRSLCPICERPYTLPFNPYAGQSVTCWTCSAEMRYDRQPSTGRYRWKVVKRGKKPPPPRKP